MAELAGPVGAEPDTITDEEADTRYRTDDKTSAPEVKQWSSTARGDKALRWYVYMRVRKKKTGPRASIQRGPIVEVSYGYHHTGWYPTEAAAEAQKNFHLLLEQGYEYDKEAQRWDPPLRLGRSQPIVPQVDAASPPAAAADDGDVEEAAVPATPPVRPARAVPIGRLSGASSLPARKRHLRQIAKRRRLSTEPQDMSAAYVDYQFSDDVINVGTRKRRSSTLGRTSKRNKRQLLWRKRREAEAEYDDDDREERSEEWRARHAKYLGELLSSNKCAEVLELSEKQLDLAKGDAKAKGVDPNTNSFDAFSYVGLSQTQRDRVYEQCRGLCMLYKHLGGYRKEGLTIVESCKRVVADNFHKYSGWTLYRYHLQYSIYADEASDGLGKLETDGRGVHDRLTLLNDNPDLQLKFTNWIRANLKGLDSYKVQDYLNNDLLPNIVEDRTHLADIYKKYQLTHPVPRSTAVRWMLDVGCSFDTTACNYYTDNHEKPETVYYRKTKYLPQEFGPDSYRMFAWIQLTASEYEEVNAAHKDSDGKGRDLPCYKYTDAAGATMYEVHLDESEAFDEWRSKQEFGGKMSVRAPAGARPLDRVGQDECAFCHNITSSRRWTILGQSVPVPKSSAGTLMVSCFQSMIWGCGLPMTQAQLDAANEARQGQHYLATDSAETLCKIQNKPPTTLKRHLAESPGIVFFDVGAAREGYWTADHMALQLEDFVDCYRVVYPDFDLEIELDHSSGHAKKKADGLDASQGKMNRKFAGKASIKHNSKITHAEGFLGPHLAVRSVPERQETVELDAAVPLGCTYAHVAGGEWGALDLNEVHSGGQVEAAGVRVGWTISAVGDVPVETDEQFAAAFEAVKSAGGEGPTPFKLSFTVKREDVKLRVGDTQSFVFGEDDLPPVFHPHADKHDKTVTKRQKKGKTGGPKKGKTGHLVMGPIPWAAAEAAGVADAGAAGVEAAGTVGADGFEDVEKTVDGYVGAPKGIEDVLFETGWLDPKVTYTLEAKVVDGVEDTSKSLRHILSRRYDFVHETTFMADLVQRLGCFLRMSPKCHPELAGQGIEYTNGKAKHYFRKHNDYNIKTMEARVKEAFGPANISVARVRKFARKARSYKCAYFSTELGGEARLDFSDIERFTVTCKTHRCTLDQDYKFIRDS